MSLGEIARCLFKPRWADGIEYRKAWNAFERLSTTDQVKVTALGKRYS